MKPLSSALQAHLDGELTTLAWLLTLTRTDGVIKGFTTFDQDLVIAGVTYKADGAFTPSRVESSSGMATDNLDIVGMLNEVDVTDADVANGLYDHARVDLAVCNWADVTQETLLLRRGWIGEVVRSGGHYVAELRGLHDALQRPIGVWYAPECRFDLGDASCGINLAARTVTGTVTGVTDKTLFTDTARTEASDLFTYGSLTWTSGPNAGLSAEVKKWDGAAQAFTLWLPMPQMIAVGDTYSVYAGCDKRFTTCQNKFANAAQFGGFPYVPGVGNILKYPQGN